MRSGLDLLNSLRSCKHFEGLSSSEFPIVDSLAKLCNKLKDSIFPGNTRKHPLEYYLQTIPALNEVCFNGSGSIVFAHWVQIVISFAFR